MQPKGSKKASAPAPTKALVLDNGPYTIKASLVPTTSINPTYDDRSTRDKCAYIASELSECKCLSKLAFQRLVEKGFIVNWEA